MCLAIPALVVELQENDTALVEISGVRKAVSLMFLDSVEAGDYVLVHAGFAMEKVNREEAEKTLAILQEAAEYGPLYE